MGRKRLRLAAVVLAALFAVAAPSAISSAQDSPPLATDSQFPAIADLIRAANDGRIAATSVPAQTPQTPFGGDSTAAPEVQDASVLTDTFAFVINPGAEFVFLDHDFDGSTDLLGEPLRVSIGQEVEVDFLDPIGAGVIFNGVAAPPYGPGGPTTMQDLIRSTGLDPAVPGVSRWGDHSAIVITPPGVTGPTPIESPVLVWGGRPAVPLPLEGCNGLTREFVLGADGELIWVGPVAAADIFNGTSTDIALTCNSGWHLNRFTNQGATFPTAATSTHAIVTPDAFVAFTQLHELPMAMGIRITGFATDSANPNQPDTTAFTSNPLFPGLGQAPPYLVGDAFPEMAGPFMINQQLQAVDPFPSGSPCGVDQWGAAFDVYLGEPGTDGVGVANIVQFASGQLTMGTWHFDENGELRIETTGGGEGYIEGFDLTGPGGGYVYTPSGSECPFDTTVTTGFDALLSGVPVPPTVPEVTETPDASSSANDPTAGADSTVDPSDSDATGTPDPIGGPTNGAPSGESSGGGGTGFEWWLLGAGSLLTAGGIAVWSNGRRPKVPVGSAMVADDEPLPGLDDDESTGDNTVTEPTEPVVREWGDKFLMSFDAEDAEWELNEADHARWKQLQDVDASAAWASAQAAEKSLQTQLKKMVSTATKEVSGGIKAYAGGVTAYSSAMNTLLRDSEDIGRLYNEWNRRGGVKDIFWWVDLADAVVGVSRLAITVGAGSAKMIVRVVKSGDEAVDTTRAATQAVGAVDEAADGAAATGRAGPNPDLYDFSDFHKFDDWLTRLLGRSFDEYVEALPAAALKLGYRMDLTHLERVLINQLITKLRLAQRGVPVKFEAEALARLHRMAQRPDFWKNLGLEAVLDLDWRVYKLVDDVELALLRSLAGSPDAANAARRIPVRTTPTMAPPAGPTLAPHTPGATVPPPAGVTLPPPANPTLPYPGAVTLPHAGPGATLPRGGAITLPPPGPGVTLPGGGVITLPHAPPGSLPAGVTLPPPAATSSPIDLLRFGDAGANPSGLGGMSVKPGATAAPSTAVDVVVTGGGGGIGAGQGYQVGAALDLLGEP